MRFPLAVAAAMAGITSLLLTGCSLATAIEESASREPIRAGCLDTRSYDTMRGGLFHPHWIEAAADADGNLVVHGHDAQDVLVDGGLLELDLIRTTSSDDPDAESALRIDLEIGADDATGGFRLTSSTLGDQDIASDTTFTADDASYEIVLPIMDAFRAMHGEPYRYATDLTWLSLDVHGDDRADDDTLGLGSRRFNCSSGTIGPVDENAAYLEDGTTYGTLEVNSMWIWCSTLNVPTPESWLPH